MVLLVLPKDEYPVIHETKHLIESFGKQYISAFSKLENVLLSNSAQHYIFWPTSSEVGVVANFDRPGSEFKLALARLNAGSSVLVMQVDAHSYNNESGVSFILFMMPTSIGTGA